ncbi:DMT family transporter [Sneathiella chinensis]|uniref:Permease n=1 Tax=Sneathiella chinensis TaxID=349750 RepID=A0ABQ5U3S1_9PROT|nr:DMT family transporter [Sneathiella chinensis]GLQ06051.1 permease [Sneathiella chinensis]
MSKLSPHLYGTLVTAFGVLVLTPDALLVRLIDADTWTLLFWRGLLFATGILGFYGLRYRLAVFGILRAMGWRGLQASLFFACSTICFVTALTNTTVANTLVIIATAPLFSAIISWLFLKERISRNTWIAILVSCGGIAIIFMDSIGGGNLLGDVAALGAALSIASQISTVRLARNVDMVPSLGLSGLMVALVMIPFATPATVPASSMGTLLFLGLVILPVAFGLITYGTRFIPAPEVSLLMLLETFLGPVWVWYFLAETPDRATLIGGGLVFATLITHGILGFRKAKPVQAPA